MNHSAKKQQHEQTRKKHKHERQEHARDAARRGSSNLPRTFLVGGIVLIIAFVVFMATR